MSEKEHSLPDENDPNIELDPEIEKIIRAAEKGSSEPGKSKTEVLKKYWEREIAEENPGDQGGMPALYKKSERELSRRNKEELAEKLGEVSERTIDEAEKDASDAVRKLHQRKDVLRARVEQLEQDAEHFEYLENHSPIDSKEAREAGEFKEDARTRLVRLKEWLFALKIAIEELDGLRYISAVPKTWEFEFAKKINYLNNLIKVRIYKRAMAKDSEEADNYEEQIRAVYKILNNVWTEWQKEAQKHMNK